MNALEAFDLFVRCLETEGAQPVLAEARSLHVAANRWFGQAEVTARPSDSPASNIIRPGNRTGTGASRDSAIRLNKRERQIVALLDKGLSDVQIASRCFSTSRWHTASAL